MLDAMQDTKLVPNIQGDLTVLAGGTTSGYRGGGTYTVGDLPLWLWPEWWLQDQSGAIVISMIVAAFINPFLTIGGYALATFLLQPLPEPSRMAAIRR